MRLSRLSWLLVFWWPCLALAAPTSEFTSTAKGKVLAKSESPDYITKLCPGLGGYEVIYHGDDARSWVNLRFAGKEIDLREGTFALSPGTFPNKSNDVVEWRGTFQKGAFVPHALIYRLEGGNDETRQIKSRLIVIRLAGAKSHVMGFAEGKDEEAKAHRLADQ